jgi:hypothetical protein
MLASGGQQMLDHAVQVGEVLLVETLGSTGAGAFTRSTLPRGRRR